MIHFQNINWRYFDIHWSCWNMICVGKNILSLLLHSNNLYDNEYSLIIDIYFYEILSTQTSSTCPPKTNLDTLSDVIDKCWRLSLIKIESVSETQTKPRWHPLIMLKHDMCRKNICCHFCCTATIRWFVISIVLPWNTFNLWQGSTNKLLYLTYIFFTWMQSQGIYSVKIFQYGSFVKISTRGL